MLQLSARTLLLPFNAGIGKGSADVILAAAGDGEEDVDDAVDAEDVHDVDDVDDAEDPVDPGDDDPDDNINELDNLTEEQRKEILDDTSAVCTTVTKLRNLAFAVIHSTTLALPAWRHTCLKLGLKPQLIPRDVVTRWNSTYDMMRFALKYRKAIDEITADKSLKLRKFELDHDDWLITEDLAAVLEQYKQATLYFSSDSANISAVIPAMDRLDNELNSTHGNRPLHPSIVVAMKLARRKLNRYYSLTDLSSVYRIAMGTYSPDHGFLLPNLLQSFTQVSSWSIFGNTSGRLSGLRRRRT
jgi:hypothetical protein